MIRPKILMGLHDDRFSATFASYAERRGYDVVLVRTKGEMLANVVTETFQRYFMDLNLGVPSSQDITPAREVYAAVQSDVESGAAKFLGISGNSRAVTEAAAEGIPALSKSAPLDEILRIFD